MGKCASGTCFTLLTLLTIGLTLALFIFATIVYAKIKTASESIFIGLIVCLCISFLLFVFGIYASCCGNNCVKGILSILYIVYALGIGAAGVVLLIYRQKLPDYFSDAYHKGSLSNSTIDTIQETFNCHFPPKATVLEDQEDCLEKFKDYVHRYGLICGIALLALFIFLLLGVCLAIRIICKKDEDISNAKSRENEQINTPLTYGW
ncbi:Leukocyte surface antigen cd53 [Tritrichomonas musculus]|uniref:Leukocyte surface antigen cd53 n=1 Tax=Tritrichomonas musculus TaxID=1915356 RepID=A0ABR2ICX7_9EUKA